MAYCLIFLVIAACPARSIRPVAPAERDEAREMLDAYLTWRLGPAQVPPPTLLAWRGENDRDGISGSIELIRAEEAPWNQWPGPTSRLLNNRAAHWFQVEVRAPGPVRWLPEHTRLELNTPGNVFRAAPSQEVLIEELLFWAYHQELHVLDGDLVARARAAGALRDAYLPRVSPTGELTGVIAFPLSITPENRRYHHEDDDLSEYHVVEMRLTLALEGPDGRRDLVWILR